MRAACLLFPWLALVLSWLVVVVVSSCLPLSQEVYATVCSELVLPTHLLPAAASSDEEPPSARKHRQRQAAGDQDEAEAEAMALLARATGKAAPAARPGARGAASFYGASGSGSGNLERRVSTGQSEAELRGKVGVNHITLGLAGSLAS